MTLIKDNSLQQLKELLEGSTIKEIRSSNISGSVCEFVVLKGNQKSSFTLFATDLGFWIRNQKNVNDGPYIDVQEMFDDMCEHMTQHIIKGDIPDPMYLLCDNVFKLTVGFKCCCGQEFSIPLSKVKESEYVPIFSSVKTRHKIAYILSKLTIVDPDMLNDCLSHFEESFPEYIPELEI